MHKRQKIYKLPTNIEMIREPVILDHKFEHVMAITLDPTKDNKEGVLRCIVKRKGEVDKRGFLDQSKLFKVKEVEGSNLEKFEVLGELEIEDKENSIDKLVGDGDMLLGLEDPDLHFEDDLLHLYFTIAVHNDNLDKIKVYLGHAEGKDLDSLVMTEPVLGVTNDGYGAKELAIAPYNSKNIRLNLVESSEMVDGIYYSVIRTAEAKKPNGKWEYKDLVLHPIHDGYAWCDGHMSPGPFISKDIIDPGEGKIVGFLNGREANDFVDGETVSYGIFAVGLMIYDYENGKIDWISDKPILIDPEAKTVTFMSQYIQLSDDKGLIYAHGDDSFVRGYYITTKQIQSFLPKL